MTCYADLNVCNVFRIQDSNRSRIGIKTDSISTPVIWIEFGDIEPRANTGLKIIDEIPINTLRYIKSVLIN